NNPPEYAAYKPQVDTHVGGISNGITGAEDNGAGIQWLNGDPETPWADWRWGEQWLPHSAWYLVAVTSLRDDWSFTVSLIEHLPDPARERLRGERLLQQRIVRGSEPQVLHRVRRVARHVEHLHVRPPWPQLFGEFDPVHLRHDHVGEQEVDLVAHALERVEGLRSVRDLDDAIAELRQRPRGEGPDLVVVFRHEDRLATAQVLRRPNVDDVVDGIAHARQIQADGGAAAGLAVD